MNNDSIETVTITLSHFKEMENEITRLKKENAEKTIYKEYMPYAKASLLNLIFLLLCGIFAFLLIKFG